MLSPIHASPLIRNQSHHIQWCFSNCNWASMLWDSTPWKFVQLASNYPLRIFRCIYLVHFTQSSVMASSSMRSSCMLKPSPWCCQNVLYNHCDCTSISHSQRSLSFASNCQVLPSTFICSPKVCHNNLITLHQLQCLKCCDRSSVHYALWLIRHSESLSVHNFNLVAFVFLILHARRNWYV